MDRLLYISGSGRSGSTVVERVFNASPRFVGVGEFHVLWRLPADEITCSCGAKFARDEFWQGVLAEAGIGSADLAELARLEGVVARSGFIARHGHRLDRLRAEADVTAFLAPQQAIFAAVRKLAGKPIIVDSSKAGPRAFALATLAEARFLHLWRDPAHVIASWRSVKFDQGLGTPMARPGVPAAATDWAKSEHFARRLAREASVGMLDYQGFCEAPAVELAAALASAELAGPDEIPWRVGEDGVPRVVDPDPHYHSLNGNPDRFDRGPITVSARSVDWQRYGAADRTAIPVAGTALGFAYPRPRR